MPVYFKLGHGTKPLESAGDFPWPYDIDVCFDPVPEPVAISEGVGHGAAGGFFSASEAIGPQWRGHFEAANAGWLIPYLERLAAALNSRAKRSSPVTSSYMGKCRIATEQVFSNSVTVGSAPPNKRTHATRDTAAVIKLNGAGGRVMRGVRP